MKGDLGVGAAFAEIFRIYRDHAAVVLSIAAIIFLPITLLSEIIAQYSEVGAGTVSLCLSGSAAYLFSGVVAPLAATAPGGPRIGEEASASLGALWKGVLPSAATLVFAGLLYTVATSIGVLLLIVPGLILVTIWAVAPTVARLEGASSRVAFIRSRDMVRGRGWQVFGLLILLTLVILAGSLLIQSLAIGILKEDTGSFIGSWLGVVVVTPVLGLFPTVLYNRLKELADVTE